MFRPVVPLIVGIITVLVPTITLDTENLPVWLDTTLTIWMFIWFLWMTSTIVVSVIKACLKAWRTPKPANRNQSNRHKKRRRSNGNYDGGSSYSYADSGGDSHCGGDGGGDCGGGGD